MLLAIAKLTTTETSSSRTSLSPTVGSAEAVAAAAAAAGPSAGWFLNLTLFTSDAFSLISISSIFISSGNSADLALTNLGRVPPNHDVGCCCC